MLLEKADARHARPEVSKEWIIGTDVDGSTGLRALKIADSTDRGVVTVGLAPCRQALILLRAAQRLINSLTTVPEYTYSSIRDT